MRVSLPLLAGYFTRPYRWLFAGILLVTFFGSLLEGLSVAAFFPVLSSLLGAEATPAPGALLRVLTRACRLLPFQDPVIAAIVLLLGILLMKSGLNLLRESLVAYASGTVQNDLKNRILATYAGSPYTFFVEHKQGQLSYNLLSASARVGLLMHRIPQIAAELLKILAIGALLLILIPGATLAVAVLILGYQQLTRFLSRRVSYHTGMGRTVAGTEQTTIANEFLTGIRQIMIFCTERDWLGRFGHQGRMYRDLYIQDSIWLAVPKVLMELTAVLGVVVFVIVSRGANPELLLVNLPMAGVFTVALFQLLSSLNVLGRFWMEMFNWMPDAERVHQALTRHRPTSEGGTRAFQTLRAGIALREVWFAYPGRQPLLTGVTLAFEKGKVTALVGPSGSGKTTLVNLLVGLFEPMRGTILIDGVDLKEFRLSTWRRRIGFVTQDPFITHATVAENIAFGRSGSPREAIENAARVANAQGFIANLPQGYDTLVGERGMKLSGGQQQRIAIARAILDDPDILIFDEATSSLDAVSERLVHEAIEQVSRDRTVILVTHRLTTVRNADRIIVLDSGRVVEQGSHAELLQTKGPYQRLLSSAQPFGPLEPAGFTRP